MEFQVKATDQIARIYGVECRVWDAISDCGLQCKMFVQSIVVRDGHDSHLLEQQMYECMYECHFFPISTSAAFTSRFSMAFSSLS